MLRLAVRIFVWMLLCQGAPLTQNAVASFDPFSTEDSVKSRGFDSTSAANQCHKEKINNPLTLADVVDLALCNNPQTRSLWASARAQAATLGINLAAYLPTLSLQGSASRSLTTIGSQAITTNSSSNSRGAGLAASYLLYDFGARAANVESAKQLLFAANATRDATLQANFLAAAQSYYALLSARASVDAAHVAETSASESLAAAEARYTAGIATPVDKLQAQTALSQATLNLVTAQGNERTAQGTLANIMGFDASQPFTLAPTEMAEPNEIVEQDIGRLIEEARRNRPDLAAADAQIKAAEAQLDASRAANMPTINLNASSNYQTVSGTQNVPGTTVVNPGTTTRSNSIGVSVSVPLFTGMRNNYQIRAAEFQLEGKVAARDLLANQVALDVWKAYQNLLTTSQALRTANDLVTSAEQSEKMTLGRYKAGVSNASIVDVLNAQSALASARQQRVAALYNFQSSRMALTQAMGQLDMTQLERRE